jgi:hypothetical protein
VIASVHIADMDMGTALAALRSSPAPSGLRFGATMTCAPLSGALLSRPSLRRVGFIAFWDDDDAVDAFLADDPAAARFRHGWHARLDPVRVSGAWPGVPDGVGHGRTDGPALTVTLGRLRLSQASRFLRASARAGASALTAQGFLWGTGMARPPLVATCSLWQDSAALAAYAHQPGAHADAVGADRRRPFHRRSVFIRCQPYRVGGSLEGRNPLSLQWTH